MAHVAPLYVRNDLMRWTLHTFSRLMIVVSSIGFFGRHAVVWLSRERAATDIFILPFPLVIL